MRHTSRTMRALLLVLALNLIGAGQNAHAARENDIEKSKPDMASTPSPVRIDLSAAQWQIAGVGIAEDESNMARADGRGITVAVLADGFDTLHPDLSGSLVAGWDATKGRSFRGAVAQVFGAAGSNGTFQATVIAANDDGKGLRGIAPSAKVMPVVVEGEHALVDPEVAAGIRWAAANGARIITLALGVSEGATNSGSEKTCEAITKARASGVLTFVPSVNDELYSQTSYQPAACAAAVVVTAVGENMANNLDRNISQPVDFSAPGYGVLGGSLSGESLPYSVTSSTLWAATTAAGAAAAVWSTQPLLGAEDLLALLVRTATPLGETSIYGAGLVDVHEAVNGSGRDTSARQQEISQRSVPVVVEAARGGDGRTAISWAPPYGVSVDGYRVETFKWQKSQAAWKQTLSQHAGRDVRAVVDVELGDNTYVAVVAVTGSGERMSAPVNYSRYNPSAPRHELDDEVAAVTDARVRWVPSGVEVTVAINDTTRGWSVLLIDPLTGEPVKRLEVPAGTLKRVITVGERDSLRTKSLLVAAGTGRNGVDRLLLPQYGLSASVVSAGTAHAGVFGTVACVTDAVFECGPKDLAPGTVVEVVDQKRKKVVARAVIRSDRTFSVVWKHQPNTYDLVLRAADEQSMRLSGRFIVR